MATDALGPVRQTDAASLDAAAATRAAAETPGLPGFAELLQQKLEEPRRGLAGIRAEIASIRDGGVLRGRAATSPSMRGSAEVESLATSQLLALRQTAAAGPDPFGWRGLARDIGDAVVGDGFGSLYERQIAQESGFSPEVALGLRRSSAGAEGIAQLMPQYYPGVDRTDPEQSLLAGAQTMRHYLEVWDGDVRRALASYNAGLGRVRSLVEAHGDDWERGLPAETRQYLASIVGPVNATVALPDAGAAAVFGGRGPGGVLISPLDRASGHESVGALLRLFGLAGLDVRAPADGRVLAADAASDGSLSLTLDHGNGWTTLLRGLAAPRVAPGDTVRRADVLAQLAPAAGGDGATGGALTFGVLLNGRPLAPTRYLLATAG